MRALLLLLSTVVLFACGAAQRPRALEDADAFERLTAIVGAWQSSSDAGTITVDYALVSRRSALVERWTSAGGTETLTVYHPDRATVLLTHYCAQGNQARLRLTEASATRFRFEREDATNVLPDASVLTTLVLSLEDDALVRIETYVDAQGAAEETSLRFERPDAS